MKIKLQNQYFAKVLLAHNRALILGNSPDRDDFLERFSNATHSPASLESFGLWETSTPNFNTFYPEITGENVIPMEGDFILPVYRLLSEVIVHPKHNPIDFSMNGILKASIGKMVGQTVYPNHDAFVGNHVGVVTKTMWQESYMAGKTKVPAGMNGVFKIDAKAHPNVARGILMDPPAIHSNSVTVSFGWEPSHKFETEGEFYSKLGTFHKDGQLIRRIVNQIDSYHETSLVAHGADGFAQKVGEDGKIQNPDYGKRQHSLSAEEFDKKKTVFFISYQNTESLSESSTPLIQNKQTETLKNTHMKELLALMVAMSLVKQETIASLADDATAEEAMGLIKPELSALLTSASKVSDLTTQLADEKQKVTDLTTQLNASKTAAEAELTKKRSAAVELYTKLKADKADDAVISMINAATEDALAVLAKDYEAQLNEKFPLTCKSCNGTEVSRSSATPGKEATPKTTRLTVKEIAENKVVASTLDR